MIRRRFKKAHGCEGNFEKPKTYQEKIQFRKLYGNHEFYAMVADKYRVRNYVAAKVGCEHLIQLLGVYDRLNESIFAELPEQFIIKANHGCKWHQIVYHKSKLDVDKTVRHFNKLARRRFGWSTDERHYRFIEPKILLRSYSAVRREDRPGIIASSAIGHPMALIILSLSWRRMAIR